MRILLAVRNKVAARKRLKSNAWYLWYWAR